MIFRWAGGWITFSYFIWKNGREKCFSKTSELFERNDGANAPVTDNGWYARMMIFMTIATI